MEPMSSEQRAALAVRYLRQADRLAAKAITGDVIDRARVEAAAHCFTIAKALEQPR